VLVRRLEDLLRRVVDAEVVHLELGRLEEHADEVLADIMDVALDGADHGGPDRLLDGADDQRLQQRHRPVHRPGR